jgi:cellulose biosynthesis protein BcsQ
MGGGFPRRSSMIRERYAVWNNKGGVGKSTLTFHIATAYASKHPNEKVLVVDMCPQANCTMMLLGSGTKGEERLIKLETQTPAPTIAGYITDRINVLAGTAKPAGATPPKWALQVSKENKELPSNVFLVPGDGNLELLAAPIAYFANAQFPQGVWGSVHKWVLELVQHLTEGPETWTVFIDTNPSFSIYTELAMIGASKLLVPFNADDSSRHAVSALFRLLYGAGKANPVYDKFTFRHQTRTNNLKAPLCHLFIGNRFTQYEGSATAFSALSDAVSAELFDIYKQSPQHFTTPTAPPKTQRGFNKAFTVDVRDFNTAGVVAAHLGQRLRTLPGGDYEVHGKSVHVKTDRITECADSVDGVVAKI